MAEGMVAGIWLSTTTREPVQIMFSGRPKGKLYTIHSKAWKMKYQTSF